MSTVEPIQRLSWRSPDRTNTQTPKSLFGSYVRTGKQSKVLRKILDPTTALAVWQRRLPLEIMQTMSALHIVMPRQQAFCIQPGDAVAVVLDSALGHFAGFFPQARDVWRSDILNLIAIMQSLAPSAALRVRIESKASHGCGLFHVDNVPLRLICTYRGRGTQWLPHNACDRAGLGSGNNYSVSDWKALRELPTGFVAVFKGLRFPGPTEQALVHRSPPADAALPRILIVIDIDLSETGRDIHGH